MVAGVPEIVSSASTVIAKAGSDAIAWPLLTLMRTLPYVPTLSAVGVPDRVPLVLSKLAHDGRLVIEKVSALPCGSDAVGVKLYACPTMALVAGVPEMTGVSVAVDGELPPSPATPAGLAELRLEGEPETPTWPHAATNSARTTSSASRKG